MRARCYRPKRRLRSEIFPLVVIMSLSLALYLAFPTGAVGFVSEEPQPRVLESVYKAFVRLDAKREAELLAAARASWQSDSSSRRVVRADLLGYMRPTVDPTISSGLRPPERVTPDPVVEYEGDFLPDGLAADAPMTLKEAEKEPAPTAAFSESDLLKLN